MSNSPSVHVNETIRLLYERGSVRNYQDRPVEPEVLNTILGAGLHAATGGNLQPYSIVVIEHPATRARLGEMCDQSFIGRAPVLLVFCLDLRRNRRLAEAGVAPYTAQHSFRHFWVAFQDTIIAAQSICTAADALGLGSCYVATILEFFEPLIEMLELPEGVFPVVLLCLGHPEVQPKVRGKLGLDVMVHREAYRDLPADELFAAYLEREGHRQHDVTAEQMKAIMATCRESCGEAFAAQCEDRIRRDGFINPVQYLFGLHYPANEMPRGNRGFLGILRKMGMDWFEEWEGPGGTG